MTWRACLLYCIAAALSVLTLGCASTGVSQSASPSARPSATMSATPTSVPTAVPISTSSPTVTSASTKEATRPSSPTFEATEAIKTVTFTIVYDNNAYDPALRTDWGFACWVETDEVTVLFDTGGDGAILLQNLEQLNLDPGRVDAVVLSHAHGDHTGGLAALLDRGVRPTVYVPASFSDQFKGQVGARTELVEITDAMIIGPGIHTTGQVTSGLVEQALAVETSQGLVVVTGCAHPGIVKMVRRANEVAGDGIALVLGGFHLGSASAAQVEGIIADLRSLGVEQVAPCHCTGDKARQAFADAFGDDAILAGVGWSIEFGFAQ